MLRSFSGGVVVKKPQANAGDARDMALIPGSGRSPGEGNSNALQYSCLGNPMDRGTWQATVHAIAKESDMTELLNNNNNFLKSKVLSYVSFFLCSSLPSFLPFCLFHSFSILNTCLNWYIKLQERQCINKMFNTTNAKAVFQAVIFCSDLV